jgi:hypothetical protein
VSVAEPSFEFIKVSLEALGRSLWVFVTRHYSGIISEYCDDGIVSGWYVSREY